MIRAAGKGAMMMVKITGMKAKIWRWILSAGGGFSDCWAHMVTPIRSGQTPIARIGPTIGKPDGS